MTDGQSPRPFTERFCEVVERTHPRRPDERRVLFAQSSLPTGCLSLLLMVETPETGWAGFAAFDPGPLERDERGSASGEVVVSRWTVPPRVARRLTSLRVPFLCQAPAVDVLDGSWLTIETLVNGVTLSLGVRASLCPEPLLPVLRLHRMACEAAEGSPEHRQLRSAVASKVKPRSRTAASSKFKPRRPR